MHVREHMIRERFATRCCEGCGHPYALGTILILVRRPAAWLVLASCGECERRCIYLVSFGETTRGAEDSRPAHRSSAPLNIQPTDALNALDAEAQNRLFADTPITARDVANMRAFLTDFDGDFRRLFADGRRPPE